MLSDANSLSMFTLGKRKLCLTTVGMEPAIFGLLGSIPTVVKHNFRFPGVNILRHCKNVNLREFVFLLHPHSPSSIVSSQF